MTVAHAARSFWPVMVVIILLVALGFSSPFDRAGEDVAGQASAGTPSIPDDGGPVASRSPMAAADVPTTAIGRAGGSVPDDEPTALEPAGMPAAGEPASGIDPALVESWYRNGCHLNPGNPSCLTLGLAVECASDPTAPGCSTDRDRDGCSDVAEVRTGFDPFDVTDCLGSGDGAPAINCLFPRGDRPCNALPGAANARITVDACAIDIAVQRALHPTNPYTCATPEPTAKANCSYLDRDPGCDGFAPREN